VCFGVYVYWCVCVCVCVCVGEQGGTALVQRLQGDPAGTSLQMQRLPAGRPPHALVA
jgi:hypothetical protein